jgi:hypothetical protein
MSSKNINLLNTTLELYDIFKIKDKNIKCNYFSVEEIKKISELLCKYPNFKKIKEERGLNSLSHLINNMTIIKLKINSKIPDYDFNKNIYYKLLYGSITKVVNNNFTTKEDTINIGIQCKYKIIKELYFAAINFQIIKKYILSDKYKIINEFRKILTMFSICKNLFSPKINTEKLKFIFLNFLEINYRKDDIVYNKNDPLDGIYLIIEGEFELIQIPKINTKEDEIEFINHEIKMEIIRNKILNHIVENDIEKKEADKLIKEIEFNKTRYYTSREKKNCDFLIKKKK